MTENELGEILNGMYENASKGEKVAQIHLFGIKYGATIIEKNFSPLEIINASKISISYRTELSKGIKLSKYVTTLSHY